MSTFMGWWQDFGDWFWTIVYRDPWDPDDSDYGSEG